MLMTIVRSIRVRLCIVEVSSILDVCDFYKGVVVYFSSILFKASLCISLKLTRFQTVAPFLCHLVCFYLTT